MADLSGMVQAAAGAGGVETDEYFNQTTLLLHGDGTNGAQNNTFLDSSTNNFTITRNGNTTQGTFSPFSVAEGEWSNYFNGAGDYLTAASNAAFGYGTGDFTIEFFIYLKKLTAGSFPIIFDQRTTSATEATPTIYYNGGLFYYASGGNRITGGTLSTNTWYHIAVCRSGTSTKMFIDGTQTGSTYTDSTNYVTSQVSIATYQPTPTNFYTNAYYSNLRIVKGTALYTSDFTPPTAPLTAIANTSLLTCQSNRFVDNSSNAFAITVNGNPSVQPFSPFAPSAAYSASVNGGSGYFNGAGDYLRATDASLAEGTGDFTLECWFYMPSSFSPALNDSLFGHDALPGYQISWQTSGFCFMKDGSIRDLNTNTVTTNIFNAWHHIAYTRQSGTLYGFIDGQLIGSVAMTNNFTNTSIDVGVNRGGTGYVNAWISDLRIIKGTALYTSAFTPPTAPLTNITNTILLLNFTNAGIFDNTGKNNLETVDNAQIDTTTKKYGTGSMEFDGTGDWLKVQNSVDIQFGTGDFTIEFWVYLATGDTGSNRGLVAKGGASTGWLVSLNTTEKVVFTYTTSTITSSGAITLDAWNHIAVVREGTGSNETKIYINGTNDGTGTVNTDFNQTEVMYIGANRAASDPMKGLIDDLRITKGVARYTANFTPPSKSFLDQ